MLIVRSKDILKRLGMVLVKLLLKRHIKMITSSMVRQLSIIVWRKGPKTSYGTRSSRWMLVVVEVDWTEWIAMRVIRVWKVEGILVGDRYLPRGRYHRMLVPMTVVLDNLIFVFCHHCFSEPGVIGLGALFEATSAVVCNSLLENDMASWSQSNGCAIFILINAVLGYFFEFFLNLYDLLMV